jgi:Domain of unknown function (DUF5658)
LTLPRNTTPPRSRFGDATLVAFIIAQALDGILTYVGITTFGTSAEANPVVAWYVTMFGAGVGLAAVKGMAIACAAALHLNARHLILGGLTLLYIAAAVVPWTRILL